MEDSVLYFVCDGNCFERIGFLHTKQKQRDHVINNNANISSSVTRDCSFCNYFLFKTDLILLLPITDTALVASKGHICCN